MLSQSPGQLEVVIEQFIESAEQQNVVLESCNGPLCESIGLEQQRYKKIKGWYKNRNGLLIF